MESINTLAPPKRQAPLRALIEIDGGELKIYPIANSEADELAIVDALRFVREDFRQ